jgi:hypothetical protein
MRLKFLSASIEKMQLRHNVTKTCHLDEGFSKFSEFGEGGAHGEVRPMSECGG